MSKFLNYVKKFLTLSFISAVAAFCIPFNNNIDGFVTTSSNTTIWSNVYEDPSSGYKYSLDNAIDETPTQAEWYGYNGDETEIDVPSSIDVASSGDESVNVPVTKATLGEEPSNAEKITLDVKNYEYSSDSITVKSPNKLNRLSKLVLKNCNSNLRNELENSALNEILKNNSNNQCVGWYKVDSQNTGNIQDSQMGDTTTTWCGEANLPTRDHGAGPENWFTAPGGVSYSKINNDWYLSSVPNNPEVTIPMAFVNLYDSSLQMINGAALVNDLQNDKIRKLVITNIQNDAQKETIMKLAKQILPGLGSGDDNPRIWQLLESNPEDGSTVMTFVKGRPPRISLDRMDNENDYSDISDNYDEDFSESESSDDIDTNTYLEFTNKLSDNNDSEESSDESNPGNQITSPNKNMNNDDDENNNSNNNSNNNNNNQSNSDNSGEKNQTKTSSLLEDTLEKWKNWYIGEGKDKSPKEQMSYLKEQIESIYDKLSSEEKEMADKYLQEINDNLEAMESPTDNNKDNNTEDTSGTPKTSTTTTTAPTSSSTNSSANTKTSDSYASPELLSLILSGSLAGLGISLKKRDE